MKFSTCVLFLTLTLECRAKTCITVPSTIESVDNQQTYTCRIDLGSNQYSCIDQESKKLWRLVKFDKQEDIFKYSNFGFLRPSELTEWNPNEDIISIKFEYQGEKLTSELGSKMKFVWYSWNKLNRPTRGFAFDEKSCKYDIVAEYDELNLIAKAQYSILPGQQKCGVFPEEVTVYFGLAGAVKKITSKFKEGGNTILFSILRTQDYCLEPTPGAR